MKRILCIILSLTFLITLCSCGESVFEKSKFVINTEKLSYDEKTDLYTTTAEFKSIEGSYPDYLVADKLVCEITDETEVLVSKTETDSAENWKFTDYIFWPGINTITVSAYVGENVVDSVSIKCDNRHDISVVSREDDGTDSDNDGLSDLFELLYAYTQPYNADSDGNGIKDGEEDFDSDGVKNADEQKNNCSPFAPDTDADGLSDAEEIEYSTDPAKEDTDDDGILDPDEIRLGFDAIGTDDSQTVISHNCQQAIGSQLNMTIDIEMKAEQLKSFDVCEIPAASSLAPDKIDGMFGSAVNFNLDGEFNSANVSFELSGDTYDAEKSYALYYVNHETLMLERVSNQSYEGNVLTATLEHFSDYLILEEPHDDFVSIRDIYEEDDDDYDNDGFLNDEDLTPYAADYFKTYEDYINYFYPDEDVISMHVSAPDSPDSGIVYNGNSGHSWMSYTKDGKTETSGFFGGIDSIEAASGSSKAGYVKTPNYYYYTDAPDTHHKYTETNPEPTLCTVALPIVLESSKYDEYNDFIKSYTKNYNLYDNNCTTYVLDCFDELDVDHDIYPYIDYEYIAKSVLTKVTFWDSYDGFLYGVDANSDVNTVLSFIMKDGCSPGQAAYCIARYYEDEAVHCYSRTDENGNVIYAYSSKHAQKLAEDRVNDKTDDVVNYAYTDKIVWNGHTYQIFDVSMTWSSAKAFCESKGGHLATISSAEEQSAIERLLDQGGKKQYWLGLDTQTGWVTGEAITYTNWDSGEPNSCSRRGLRERYTHILNVPNPARGNSARLKWNDMFNDNTFPDEEDNFSLHTVGIICEWDNVIQ